ncbi:hypothetical protein PHLCEN_2v1098 [Hermanssonia centrifuga]|uniref:SPRY domain-containing protein n=1 Tax=Hermanssonia centrifuga TaxID=98765 RepID=A0A2R6S4B8_9APHY|nr:hypothetical protein PHLCEN_2v1098 [Hermanssonia centrifuga]
MDYMATSAPSTGSNSEATDVSMTQGGDLPVLYGLVSLLVQRELVTQEFEMRVDGVTLVPNYSSWGRWQNLQFLFLISFIRLRSTSSSQIGFLYVARVMEGDVIGCGVDFDDEIIFFTKNGVLAGKYMLLNVVSLECLNMQTGVATFTSYNIERSAKLSSRWHMIIRPLASLSTPAIPPFNGIYAARMNTSIA